MQMKTEDANKVEQKKLRGRALAIREGRVGSKVRYSKRVEKMLEQLAREYR